MLLPVAIVLCASALSSLVLAQDDGYSGYLRKQEGDPDSAVYRTSNTDTAGRRLPEDPDVYLNATVGVESISVRVDNLTAKINLDAKVLDLLHFSAGVDASITHVGLLIEDVQAKVELEARLGTVVEMVGDVLNAIDLNPLVAAVGKNVGKVAGSATGAVGGVLQGVTSRSADPGNSGTSESHGLKQSLQQNILCSLNDYNGNVHTNRVLNQKGEIVDISLDEDGQELSREVVGWYEEAMDFTGNEKEITVDGEVTEYESEYVYRPFPGVECVCLIYRRPDGGVTRTEVVAESMGGGSSIFTR